MDRGPFGSTNTTPRRCTATTARNTKRGYGKSRDGTAERVCTVNPHLLNVGDSSWLAKKYGKLDQNWPAMLYDGFVECMRVLKTDGVLIFKWAESDIPAEKVWKAIGEKPLFGHHSGKRSKTFWACFMKFGEVKKGGAINE